MKIPTKTPLPLRALAALAAFALAGSQAFAGMPVIDAANLANSQISHVATLAKWVESIAQLKSQLQSLKQQIDIQDDLRSWAGDPAKAARSLVLDVLGDTDFLREYGRARDAITRDTDSLDILTRDDRNTYRPVETPDIEGNAVEHDPRLYRRFSTLAARQENARAVSDELHGRARELQEEIALSLADLRSAGTDAEVQKIAAKLSVLNGQLAQLESTRRREIDEVFVQKLANDSQAEVERVAAAELRATDDFLANQRISAFVRGLNPYARRAQ